jgi:hypothetical protein
VGITVKENRIRKKVKIYKKKLGLDLDDVGGDDDVTS